MKTVNKIGLGVLLSVIFVASSVSAITLTQITNPTLLWEGLVRVACTSSGQLCNPKYDINLTTTVATPLRLDYQVPSGNCSSINVDVYIDNTLSGSTGWIGRGSGNMSGTFTIPSVAPGAHTISLQATGRRGGCNVGRLHSWSLPLKIYGKQQTVNTGVCSTNSQCGTNGYTGSETCQGGNVWQNYTTYTCNNPGTASSTCTPSTVSQQKTVCGTNQTCSGGTCTTNSIPTLTANCSTSPSSVLVNNSVQFTPAPLGGTGVYTYQWSGACNGFSQNCYNSYTNAGTQTATLTVVSGTQTATANCSVAVNSPTTNTYVFHSTYRCFGNGVYWFDSNGSRQDLYQACTGNQTCPTNSSVCVNQVINPPIVNPPNYGNSALTLLARNLSSGNLNWATSVSATPSDVVQFQIIVKNTTSVPMNNITIRNILPANLVYYNNVTLDGVANSGSVVNGLLIGSLSQGQTKIITYQAQVAPAQNFSFGTTTLTNSISTTSTDANFTPATSTALVVITRGGILGATDAPTGWSDNPIFGSFFLPLILGIIGFWLFRNGYIKMPKFKKTY